MAAHVGGFQMKRDIRILIVEDDNFEARAMEAFFANVNGYRVVGIADNVDEAAELVKDQKPDVVILDFTLKGSIGSDLVEDIRTDEDILQPYIIAFPAILDRAKRDVLMSKGVNEVLLKGDITNNPKMIYRYIRDYYPAYLKETQQESKLDLPVITKTEEKGRLTKRITSDMERMGITSNYKGFHHILYIIEVSVANKENFPKLEKFYKEIAGKEGVAPDSVNKRIKKVIERAFSTDFHGITKEVYNPEFGKSRSKPTNSQFISHFVHKYIEEG